MHSATKFIAGHSDVMAGVLAVKGEKYVASTLFYLRHFFEISAFLIIVLNFPDWQRRCISSKTQKVLD